MMHVLLNFLVFLSPFLLGSILGTQESARIVRF